MIRIHSCIAVIAVVLWAFPAQAASVINFDDLTFANYDPIPGGYGDNLPQTPDVVASFTTLNVDGSVYSNDMLLWNSGYGDLSKVAFAASNGKIAEVRLDAAAGYEVELQSFLLAGWPQTDLGASVLRILDGSGGVLWDSSGATILGSQGTHSTFTPNLRGSTLRIQWGTNWNIGIDDITFAQVDAMAVPEPAGIVMLSIGGVAATMLVARRKRA